MPTLEELSAELLRTVSEQREKRRAAILAETGGDNSHQALVELLVRRKQEFLLELLPQDLSVENFSFTSGTDEAQISEHRVRLGECAKCPPGGGRCDTDQDPYDHVGKIPMYNNGSIEYQRCAKWTEYRFRRHLGQMGIPLSMRHVTLTPAMRDAQFGISPYVPKTPSQEAALKACITISEWTAEQERNLVLLGKPGTGKTHLVCALLRRLLAGRRIKEALFFYTPTLTHQLSYQRGYEDRDALVQQAINTEVLVLDDLGATRIGDFERDHILMILHERHASNKSVLVTTNESTKTLIDLVGERIVSRIQQSTLCIVEGPDNRAGKQ